MHAEENIRRAQRAELLLNDDLFKEAIAALHKRALAMFKQAGPKDHEALMHARILYDVTESFINEFAKIVRDGKYEKLKAV